MSHLSTNDLDAIQCLWRCLKYSQLYIHNATAARQTLDVGVLPQPRQPNAYSQRFQLQLKGLETLGFSPDWRNMERASEYWDLIHPPKGFHLELLYASVKERVSVLTCNSDEVAFGGGWLTIACEAIQIVDAVGRPIPLETLEESV